MESIFDNYSKRRGALIRALTEGSKRESASDLCPYVFLDYILLASSSLCNVVDLVSKVVIISGPFYFVSSTTALVQMYCCIQVRTDTAASAIFFPD